MQGIINYFLFCADFFLYCVGSVFFIVSCLWFLIIRIIFTRNAGYAAVNNHGRKNTYRHPDPGVLIHHVTIETIIVPEEVTAPVKMEKSEGDGEDIIAQVFYGWLTDALHTDLEICARQPGR
jgi:hypothetical protein